MKYVLLYTNRPDLDAAVPEERRAEVYQAIYGWFEKHGAVMSRRRRRTARTGNSHVCEVRAERRSTGGRSTGHSRRQRKMSAGSASSTFPTSTPPSPSSRSGRRSSCPALQWRSGRSSITATTCEPRAYEELKSRFARSAHVP